MDIRPQMATFYFTKVLSIFLNRFADFLRGTEENLQRSHIFYHTVSHHDPARKYNWPKCQLSRFSFLLCMSDF